MRAEEKWRRTRRQTRFRQALCFVMPVLIRHLFISSGHSYFGRHGKAPGPYPITEVDQVECVSGRGLRGDRFFDYKENYRGQVTLFGWDVFEKMRRELSASAAQPAALRRNVVVEGLDLPPLIGQPFVLQGVQLQGVEECRPCYWMDQAIAPGAEAWLRGRGGLRCRIISDGVLARSEPVRLQEITRSLV